MAPRPTNLWSQGLDTKNLDTQSSGLDRYLDAVEVACCERQLPSALAQLVTIGHQNREVFHCFALCCGCNLYYARRL
jgi:hypothetical protein